MKTYLLHIETATVVCSAAISCNGQVVAIEETDASFKHAASLTIFIENILKKATLTLNDISGVVISAGPGSYTGLRIGTSVAKGICYALNKPLIAIPTLKSLAWAAKQRYSDSDYFIPMIDARRMEVYTAIFDKELYIIGDTHAHILDDQSFTSYLKQGRCTFIGDGAAKFGKICTHDNGTFSSIKCSANYTASLGYEAFLQEDFVDVAYFSPAYFKSPNITKSKKKVL